MGGRMTLFELKEELLKKTIRPVYIFTGDEIAIMDIYIDKIGKMVGNVSRVDTVGQIYSKLQNASILSKPTCYIVRDDKEYLQQEKIWADVNTGKVVGDNTIILIYSNLDKRGKFVKQYGHQAVEFERLVPEVLAKYIKKDIGLDVTHGVELATKCNSDYSRVQLECDKIVNLQKARGYKTIEEAYKAALHEKLIYTYAADVIFEFIDSVCKRQRTISFRLLQELRELNDGPLGALSLLYTNFRSMLLVQSSGKDADITQRTGLTGWQVKLAKEKGNKYSIGELVRILRTLRETEKGIKTGLIDSDMALDYVLINIL